MTERAAARRAASLVSTQWLADRLDAPDILVVDASWHIPIYNRDALAEFAEGHIPGAVYFDIDVVADPDHELTHMLPDAARFAETVGALGITRDTHVVAYDKAGLYSAARVWWMFRLYGHEKVSVLDGGFPKWAAEGRSVASGAVEPRATRYMIPNGNPAKIRTRDQMLANVTSREEMVIDARTEDLYLGTRKNPYPGVRNGHIPGAVNLFVGTLMAPDDKTMLPPDTLAAKFTSVGAGHDQTVVFSCGSGVTACIMALAYDSLGSDRWSVYDGSWDEWGRWEVAPVETEAVMPKPR